MQPAEDSNAEEPVGRRDLLVRVEEDLATRGRAALTGAAGSGKTAMADVIAARAGARGERVLRLAPGESDCVVPGAGVAGLLGDSPPQRAPGTGPAAALQVSAGATGPDTDGILAASAAPGPPAASDVPEASAAPLGPGVRDASEAAGTDAVPEGPARPGAPEAPPGPGRPDVPDGSGPSDTAAASDGTDVPGASGTAAVPGTAGTPTAPVAPTPPTVPAIRQLLAPHGPPTFLIIDNAQWLDARSVTLLRSALNPAPPGLRVLVLERPVPTCVSAEPRAAALFGIPGAAPDPYPLPPLDHERTTDLLLRHRLPTAAAGRIHRASGGNPGLALAVARSLADAPHPLHPAEDIPLSEQTRAAARQMLSAVPEAVRNTLLRAALATCPSTAPIRRSGRPDAERELAAAQRAGLITLSVDGAVTFTAGALPATLTADTTPAERAACHAELATAVDDPVEAVRHRALATDTPDGELAVELTAAAAACRRRGNRALAASLGLLAADRTPADRPAAALARLVAATEDAARSGRPDLARRAAQAVLARDASPADRVRARLAIADTAGQRLADLDEIYAHALADAAGVPALRAAVQLRLTWKLLLSDGDPVGAREAALEAGAVATAEGDQELAAMALTAQARMGRILGDPDTERTLAQAQALEASVVSSGVHNSARILAIRHALFDDRLAEARARLLSLLPAVERAGMAEDVVEVVRSLAETAARWGRCAEALSYARRAVALSDDAGLSPGPAWYAAAMAESAGGSFARAADHARRGVRASEEEQDQMFLARNLYALGRVELVTGDAAGAVRTLTRVRELGMSRLVVDPSMLRWEEELAEALVMAGAPDEAADLLSAVRPVAERLGRVSVLAALDRAEALRLAARGDSDAATSLLADVSTRFTTLELPLEQARTLLALSHVEHARNRPAPSWTALQEAAAVFARTGATPWLALTAADRRTPYCR